MAHAVWADPAADPDFGNVGDKVDVTGTIDTAFGPVEVYWDSLDPADMIDEGTADVSAEYDIEITIPEDVQGTHYIIVKDATTDTSGYDIFTINPEIVLDPTKGLPGDPITVTGTGFGDEVEVGIYLGAITLKTESVTIVAGETVTGTLTETPVVITSVEILTDVTITGLVGGLDIIPVVVSDILVTDNGKGTLTGEA
ncbi:hypothetical protein GH146_00480, partial [archaeon]|nr:hypothetical protein [archaeon]